MGFGKLPDCRPKLFVRMVRAKESPDQIQFAFRKMPF